MNPDSILSESRLNSAMIKEYHADLEDFYRRHLAKISKTADFGIINVVIHDIAKLEIPLPIAEIILNAQPPNDPYAKSDFINTLTKNKLAQGIGENNEIFRLITHEIGKKGYVDMLNILINKGINVNLKVIFEYAIPNNLLIMQRLLELDPTLKRQLNNLDILLEASDNQLKFILDQGLDRNTILEYVESIFESNAADKLPLIVPYINENDWRNAIMVYANSNLITDSMAEKIIRTIPGMHGEKRYLLRKTDMLQFDEINTILQLLDPSYPGANRLLVRESPHSLSQLINLYRIHKNDFIPFLEKEVMDKVAKELPLSDEYSKAVDKFGKKAIIDYQNENFILKSNLSVIEAIVNNKIIQILNSNGVNVSQETNINDPDATAWFVTQGIYETTINGLLLKLLRGSVLYLLKSFDIIFQEIEEGSAMMALK
jgi:hypothetical protein